MERKREKEKERREDKGEGRVPVEGCGFSSGGGRSLQRDMNPVLPGEKVMREGEREREREGKKLNQISGGEARMEREKKKKKKKANLQKADQISFLVWVHPKRP